MIPVTSRRADGIEVELGTRGGERRCLASLPMAPGLSSLCLGAPHPKVLPSPLLHMSITPRRLGLSPGEGVTTRASNCLLGFASRCSCDGSSPGYSQIVMAQVAPVVKNLPASAG